MKAIIKKDIVEIDQNIYLEERRKLLRRLAIGLSVIFIMLTVLFLGNKNYYNLEIKKSDLDSIVQKKTAKINQFINLNSYIDKAVTEVNEINLAEKKIGSNSMIYDFENIVSELAYYYKLTGNVNVIISNASNNKQIAPTKITLSFQSKDDERIIQFIDTLILNLQGFALIQKINIKREKGIFLTETSIDWYTAKKIRQDFLQKRKIIITPHLINSPIEEKYRISIWQGSIMP